MIKSDALAREQALAEALPEAPRPGDLVACRLTGRPTVIFGVVDAVTAESLTLRFPAELRSHSLMTANPITRQPELSTIPILFFLPMPLESFTWSEFGPVHVLRDDDLNTSFAYAREVLSTYRANVAKWDPKAVRVPSRLVETG